MMPWPHTKREQEICDVAFRLMRSARSQGFVHGILLATGAWFTVLLILYTAGVI
jgi:hypothetical protein